MSNSKRRCSVCKNYFPHDELKGTVSVTCEECLPEKFKRSRPPSKRKNGPPTDVRKKVKKRDGERCRFCPRHLNLQCHHIKYLSEGGPNHEANLITLCDDHHFLVHSDKGFYQPILLAYIWYRYVNNKRYTIPQIIEKLERLDLLPER